MNNLVAFDQMTQEKLRDLLVAQHEKLAQVRRERGKRSLTAINYDSSIRSLGEYMREHGHELPTRSVLEQWRDDMTDGIILSSKGKPLAVKSINARLAAARKLLRGVAADTTDIQTRMVLESWANVADAKAIQMQDWDEDSSGIWLTLDSLTAMVNSPDTRTIAGLRDRALIAVMGGAGLRVFEAVALRLSDVTEKKEVHGIRVRSGKFKKSRMVALGNADHWVLVAIRDYVARLKIEPDDFIFWAFEKVGDQYVAVAPLSKRQAQRIVGGYPAEYKGTLISVPAHRLRATYARLCREAAGEWDEIRDNMGHSSVEITEGYVGKNIPLDRRVPGWGIELKK